MKRRSPATPPASHAADLAALHEARPPTASPAVPYGPPSHQHRPAEPPAAESPRVSRHPYDVNPKPSHPAPSWPAATPNLRAPRPYRQAALLSLRARPPWARTRQPPPPLVQRRAHPTQPPLPRALDQPARPPSRRAPGLRARPPWAQGYDPGLLPRRLARAEPSGRPARQPHRLGPAHPAIPVRPARPARSNPRVSRVRPEPAAPTRPPLPGPARPPPATQRARRHPAGSTALAEACSRPGANPPAVAATGSTAYHRVSPARHRPVRPPAPPAAAT